MVGFTRHVWLSLFPLGKTFKIAIATMRSLATLVPVVSRSKKQIGLVSFNSIGTVCATKVVIVIFVIWLKDYFLSVYYSSHLALMHRG